MKKLVVFGLVLLAIALVLDFGARAYAESQASNVLKTSLHLSRKPQVSLNGFPFLVHLATERFDSVTIDGRDTWKDPALYSFRRAQRTGRFAGVVRPPS